MNDQLIYILHPWSRSWSTRSPCWTRPSSSGASTGRPPCSTWSKTTSTGTWQQFPANCSRKSPSQLLVKFVMNIRPLTPINICCTLLKEQSRGQGDHQGVEGGAAGGEARAQGCLQPTLRLHLPDAQGGTLSWMGFEIWHINVSEVTIHWIYVDQG